MSRNACNWMQSWSDKLPLPTINTTRVWEYRQCPQSPSSQAKINSCLYHYQKITLNLTITRTSLLETSRCLALKGHFMLDIKIGMHPITWHLSGLKWKQATQTFARNQKMFHNIDRLHTVQEYSITVCTL